MANPKELIYVSDLDGTLLKPNSFLPQEAIERLNYLLEKGLRFTIATARNYDSVQPILKNLNLNIPVILFNGVYLTNFQTGENKFISDPDFLKFEKFKRNTSTPTPTHIYLSK